MTPNLSLALKPPGLCREKLSSPAEPPALLLCSSLPLSAGSSTGRASPGWGQGQGPPPLSAWGCVPPPVQVLCAEGGGGEPTAGETRAPSPTSAASQHLGTPGARAQQLSLPRLLRPKFSLQGEGNAVPTWNDCREFQLRKLKCFGGRSDEQTRSSSRNPISVDTHLQISQGRPLVANP